MAVARRTRRIFLDVRRRASKKGLQWEDFLPTIISAYSSLNKFQREILEKLNVPGSGLGLRPKYSIYSLNMFRDLCASAVIHFGVLKRSFRGARRGSAAQ